MRQSELMARADALTDAIRVADDAIGDRQPHDQALAIIRALKRLRDESPARVHTLERVDYLEIVQRKARFVWLERYGSAVAEGHASGASIMTPLGLLSCRTWRTQWGADRLAWCSEYMLAGEPITVREIKAAGLAQRPTSRTRQKKEPTKWQSTQS